MRTARRVLPKSLAPHGRGLERVYTSIRRELGDVEEHLTAIARSPNPLIADIGSYLFQKTGKRIRPALVLLCAKLTGAASAENIQLAALVELIHTSSLIHDDIIDNAGTRRGKATVHAKWGPNVTVLMGDYLYIKTINLSLQSRYPRVTEILTDVSAQMIEGEIKEYTQSGNLSLNEKAYLDIIEKKTAALFGASCRLGGILGEAPAAAEQALADYGLNLGMCFQIVDDLLDFTGEEKVLGKPVLSDLAEGRITLPLIHTLGHNGASTRRRIQDLMKKQTKNRTVQKEILKLVRTNGGLKYAFARAGSYCQKAKLSLDIFPKSAVRDSLSLLSDFVLKRNI